MTRIALDIYAEDDDANARTIEISLEADVGYGVLLDAARAACAVIDADGVTTGPDAPLAAPAPDPGVTPTPTPSRFAVDPDILIRDRGHG